MRSFNHGFNNSIPIAVGDRYYAQDLNDDFNYLKHLPYEGRDGVIVPPTATRDSKLLALQGGVGAVLYDTTVVDAEQEFVIPPATKVEKRYVRVEFKSTTLELKRGYIQASVTENGAGQRSKTLNAGQYASRVTYDGNITIDEARDESKILLGVADTDGFALICGNEVVRLEQDSGNVLELLNWKEYRVSNATLKGGNVPKIVDSTIENPVEGEYLRCNVSGKSSNATFRHCHVEATGTFEDCRMYHCDVVLTGTLKDTFLSFCQLEANGKLESTKVYPQSVIAHSVIDLKKSVTSVLTPDTYRLVDVTFIYPEQIEEEQLGSKEWNAVVTQVYEGQEEDEGDENT